MIVTSELYILSMESGSLISLYFGMIMLSCRFIDRVYFFLLESDVSFQAHGGRNDGMLLVPTCTEIFYLQF